MHIPWVGVEMTEEYCALAKDRVKTIVDAPDWFELQQKRSKKEIAKDQMELF